MNSLDEVVNDYISTPVNGYPSCRARLSGYLKWFKLRKNFLDVIDGAILRNHPHQNCLSWEYRRDIASKLILAQAVFETHTTFQEIYEVVKSCACPPYKNANLLVYDLSLRIGAYKDLFPSNIYLHRGALEGAQIVLNQKKLPNLISASSLPKEFSVLKPHEIEDCLCIYKENIKHLMRKNS